MKSKGKVNNENKQSIFYRNKEEKKKMEDQNKIKTEITYLTNDPQNKEIKIIDTNNFSIRMTGGRTNKKRKLLRKKTRKKIKTIKKKSIKKKRSRRR